MTAKDLGYLYLPQEVVSEQDYNDYVKLLQPVSLEDTNSFDEIVAEDCSTGSCPIK